MSIYKKLFEAKKEIGAITKDAKNPFFKSNYFDINSLLREVEPILQKHGLLLLQPISNGAVTTVIYDVETDNKNYMSSCIALPDLKDPQKLGSAITYYRRYTLQSLLGLQAEDDDGNKASAGVNRVSLEQTKEQIKQLKTKEEVRSFYANLDKQTKDNLKTFATEFGLKLTK